MKMARLVTSVLVLASVSWLCVDAVIEEIPLPPRMKACFDRARAKGDLTVQIGEKVVWHCIHGSLWTMANQNGKQREVPKVAMKWFADLIHKSYSAAEVRSRQRRQAIIGARNRNRRHLRVRKEYRMMSDLERNNFHRALQLLKTDTSIPPNRFDSLGLLHEFLGERSHDGPNFLLWHRLFLVVAENALREKVPSVTIPYWDSTLDGGLDDPRSSILWSPAFMGNGNGRIKTGPFVNWRTPYGPLMRNFGDGGTMMNWTSLRDTFSRNHLEEIANPNGDPRSNLEDHHGEPHLWVGGYMAPVALAGAENALREKIPSVTIPYWDSCLDSGLFDPRTSIIWSHLFLGNGNGQVRTGPFANWVTPYGPLMRNFGDGGTMMNWTSIRRTFSRKFYSEIANPTGNARYVLEDSHNEPHLWVGGYMAPVALAGFDPAFLVHHSFIDLVWEIFRRLQKRKGVDPTTDYPRNFNGPPGHQYNDPSGFGSLLNRHALSDVFTSEMYSYQPPPTCTREKPTCGSRYIRCDFSTNRPQCVSASIFEVSTTPAYNIGAVQRMKRSASIGMMTNTSQAPPYIKDIQTAADLKCSPENVNDHYINTYILDGVTNKGGWSYIPLNVIVRRKSFGQIGPYQAAAYGKCNGGRHQPFRVFVESTGINYQGFFKEIAHIVDSVTVSSAVTYIGVKTPTESPIEVAIAAYDSCGRICRPFCRSENGKHFRACSGAVRIRQDLPKQYSASVSAMSAILWQDNELGMPSMDDKQLFLNVVCDENIIWPWAS